MSANEGSPSFVHLHVHTQYSLLEGASRVKDLCQKTQELGMPALAITDTANLFGAIDFFRAAEKHSIRPILGSEILWSPGGDTPAPIPPKGSKRVAPRSGQLKPQFHHLTLLCENLKGYQNLCKILTESYLNAYQRQPGSQPLVDRSLLEKYASGLIVLSGCLRGDLSYQILNGGEETARRLAEWFRKTFQGRFYFELQDSGIPEQIHVNEVLFDWAKKLKIPCVGTSDCHYLEPEDAEAQEVLQCIELNRNLDFERQSSLVPSEFYLKSPEQMRANFERFPGVCDRTLEIADRCKVEFQFEDEKGAKIYHIPNFRPEGLSENAKFDLEKYFRDQAKVGLEARFKEKRFKAIKGNEKIYWERLESELEMIVRTGFAGYFLIVSDFIIWAKKDGIPVGPGRGSGAGSLVAFALQITDIDPIEFNLLFERFINPERISMPDFDIDFCQDRRGEVIDYVTKKYGEENVCQIITFGKLQARAVIKDVGRVMGLSFAEMDQVTKLMPNELNLTIQGALDKEPQLREKIESDGRLKKVIEYALKLEGLYRNAGVHAAGVIITEKPVVTYCPLYVGSEGAVVTQFDKDFAEEIGLVKFDFLGLKTLTVIDNAIRLIEEDFSIEDIDYTDAAVFELIGSGDTDGVFQIESSGMKDLCTRLQPSSVEDLTAINALYRPGPLGSGMVDDFIDRKHGRKPIEYEVDSLASILKDTYGVILYQEQVMQIARELAGYSLGQADMLRRAMGKKKAAEMARHREIFSEGAKKRGLDPKKADTIYELMAKFAEYGFNKSHSAAYAVLTYQTAYLKHYYSAEFMAALMTTEMNNTDKLSKYISDARAHKISVLPPDVNFSLSRFSVEKSEDGKKSVRFGLEAIKGVGGAAVEAIIEARKEEKFSDVLNFARRVSTRKVNKKVWEALILSGAVDGISEVNRPTLLASLEGLLEHAADEQEERELGQSSLFDSFSAEEIKLVTPAENVFRTQEDWPLSKKLSQERQVVGFYVSGHPLDHWQKIADDWLGWNTKRLRDEHERRQAKEFEKAQRAPQPQQQRQNWGYQRQQRKEIQVACLLSSMREITTKKGSRMAFAQMEDLYGSLELVIFPDAFEANQEILKKALTEAEPLLLNVEVEWKEEMVKLFPRSAQWLAEAHKGRARNVILTLEPKDVSIDQLRELKRSLLEHRGKCPVKIQFVDSKFKTRLELPRDLKVEGTPKLCAAVNRIFGSQVVTLQ